ncbi:MAG: hypothetical protein VX519_02740 [Myxococcota bacterium]|nr:hypothetical protein [Myxococcota bacterium]
MMPVAIWLVGCLAWFLGAPWWVQGFTCIPAVLWAPGVPWARPILGSKTALQMGVDAAWISIVFAVVDVTAVRTLGGGGALLLGLSGAWLALGTWKNRNHSALKPSQSAIAGLACTALLLCATAGAQSHRLSRGLDCWWYSSDVDQSLGESIPWSATEGWGVERRFGWPEDQVTLQGAVLEDAGGGGGTLEVQGTGAFAVLLQAAIGSTLSISQDGVQRSGTVQRDVTESEEEGPVARYLERGSVAVVLPVKPGLVTVEVEAQGPTRVYVLPGRLAVDSLDQSGEARFAHYYQILNIVENQRWAAEVLETRHLTINQPPLWSYVLAVPTLLVGPELPASSLLLLWVLVLIAATGLLLIELSAPNAPWSAWLLPGCFAAVHLQLMLQPGSINFPDSLYTAALLGGAASLLSRDGSARVTLLGLCAGLLRYPGTITITLWALFLGRRTPWRSLATLWGSVLGLSAVLAVSAALTGQLGEWLDILYFETIPEHYANNPEAPAFWDRPWPFYKTWFAYTGGALMLVLPLASRPSRWLTGCAVAYSLMLCTIDHLTTHYFLPLVAMTAAAIAANATGLNHRFLRVILPLAALFLAGLFIMGGSV